MQVYNKYIFVLVRVSVLICECVCVSVYALSCRSFSYAVIVFRVHTTTKICLYVNRVVV